MGKAPVGWRLEAAGGLAVSVARADVAAALQAATRENARSPEPPKGAGERGVREQSFRPSDSRDVPLIVSNQTERARHGSAMSRSAVEHSLETFKITY